MLKTSRLRGLAKRSVRKLGFEVRRVDPGASVEVLLLALLRELEIDLVLDVGANEGQFADSLRGEGYDGRIVSFEPTAGPFAKLESKRRDPKWEARKLALGAAAGQAVINVPISEDGGMASFLPAAPGAFERYGVSGENQPTETVEVARLDAIALGSYARALLKLDTQGFDLEVARGAAGMLDRVSLVLTEVSFKPLYAGQPTWRESLEHFAGLGFEPAGFFPVVRDSNWSLVEADCVLVRKG